jgi:endonuclease/exonuclease/phosphatase family metal-dependent hydrolase
LAADEGEDVGVVWTPSEDECKARCQAEGDCQSASLCPQWNGCYMKKKSFSGGEATVSQGECKTLYRTSCQGTPPSTPAPTRAPTSAPTPAPTPAPTQATVPVGSEGCWRELSGLAADEGEEVGQTVYTSSAAECQAACDGRVDCSSISMCPQWGTCFMKARALTGGEATVSNGECRTYYRAQGDGCDAVTQPTAAPGSSEKVKVVTYNLFWWNAFGSNRWSSGESVLRNIRDNLGSALLGVQECDDPWLVQQSTGYQPASSFAGAQGTFVDGGLFEVSSAAGATGHQDLQATGKWGPRYATWAQVSHKPTGRSIWHFNTHWCVHSGNGRTCTWETRLSGARNMVDLIREKAGTQGGALRDPVVVTGDFNVFNGGVNEAGMQHFLNNGFSLAKYAYVDFVLFSTPHFRAVSSGVGDSAGSDHAPVFAELEFL